MTSSGPLYMHFESFQCILVQLERMPKTAYRTRKAAISCCSQECLLMDLAASTSILSTNMDVASNQLRQVFSVTGWF